MNAHKGYSVEQLKAAFDMVKNPSDWKAPITASMGGESVMAVCAAIEFYTATTPKVGLDARTMTYVVTSEGYRRGPAGDN